MSNNNNKQPLDLTESLLVFDKAQAPSTTRVQSGEASTNTPTVNELDYEGISLVERRSRDVKPREKNDSVGISEINQPDVTTPNLSHSDELTIGLLLDCAERGENRGNQPSPSICKVSRILRDLSKSSYKPQLVSIGPIHREDKKLQKFESLKECYLNDLLSRFEEHSAPKKTLEAFLLKVNDLIPQIRESYAGVKKNYSDDDLARMMVMDGCFILEFCFKHNDEDEYLPNKMQNLRIAMDLILLENQVPFVVLQTLFNCMAPYIGSVTLRQVLDIYLAPYTKLFYSQGREKSPTTDASCTDDDSDSTHDHVLSNILDKYLAPYIKRFCSLLPEKIPTTDVEHSDLPEKNSPTDVDLPEKNSTTDVDSDPTHDHVLGYLHRRYQLTAAKSSNREERKENLVYHSIVELDRSGMKFKPHQENEWSMTIKFQSLPVFRCLPWFWSKPTLFMPILMIDDFTEVILRNFIAYEQSFPQGRYHFTSYVKAMDMLIDTQEDVAILAESKVLFNSLCSNREAADMINKIGEKFFVTDFYYTEEFKQMDNYYNACWPWITRTYFSNPWNVFSLIAGIIVFLATMVATIFAVLDYFR